MSSRFHVRRLRVSDLDRIQEIEQASFGKDAYDRNLFAEYLHKCGGLFLGVLAGRRVCGYMITCIHSNRPSAEVISLAVDPKSRGKGAASLLMQSTIGKLCRRGTPRLSLMVKVTNREAFRFYEKWGFKKTRRVKAYYEDGEDGFRMVARLDGSTGEF
jgi:[ribosomal protein S18]-alanine N-acetyltransferase